MGLKNIDIEKHLVEFEILKNQLATILKNSKYDSTYLALDGSNANQNIDIGVYGLNLSGAITGGGSGHDQFSDFVANEHIDWTNATQNLLTTGTISSTNSIGVGTSSPTSKLDVRQSIDTPEGGMSLGGKTGANNRFQIFLDSSDNLLYRWAATGVAPLTLKANGDAHIAGKITNNGLIWSNGTTGATPTSGASTRFMWIPAKAAFRAGSVNDTQWDDTNIGISTVAMGNGVTANGPYAVAMGNNTAAGGWGAVAMGEATIAYGQSTVAMGETTSATGTASVAMGYQSTASGPYSIAIGTGNLASGMGATSLGFFTIAGGWASAAFGLNSNFSSGNFNASGQGSFVTGHATSGNTQTATGTASVAMGENVNSTQNLALTFGSNFTNNTANSFQVGFGSATFSVEDKSIVMDVAKTTTGDPTGVEGKIYWNTIDNVIKMFADGAWRTLASW